MTGKGEKGQAGRIERGSSLTRLEKMKILRERLEVERKSIITSKVDWLKKMVETAPYIEEGRMNGLCSYYSYQAEYEREMAVGSMIRILDKWIPREESDE
jgi:hypothetical protein